MGKVYLISGAQATGVNFELEDATPIVPLRAVLLQFPKPQALDELEIPSAALSIALHPDAARELAYELLRAAESLD